jgi:hypothetical protein
MAVGVENTNWANNTTSAGVTSLSPTLTVTSANALIVLVGLPGGSAVTAVWDSGGTNQSMTLIKSFSGTPGTIYVFGLLAPTTGSKTLKVSWTFQGNALVAVAGLTGVDQSAISTSFTSFTTSGAAATASVAVTTATNNGAFAIGLDDNAGASASGGSNTVINLTNFIANVGDAIAHYQVTSGAGSVTLSYTPGGGANWIYAGVNVVATGGVASGASGGTLAVMGVG